MVKKKKTVQGHCRNSVPVPTYIHLTAFVSLELANSNFKTQTFQHKTIHRHRNCVLTG